MSSDYVFLPFYAIHITLIVFILMILILMCLLYLLVCKRYRIDESYRIRVSIPEVQYTKTKTSSFHLPKIHKTNTFELLRPCSVESGLQRYISTPQVSDENQSDQNKSYAERVKNKIPDQIEIIAPDKMAALCDAILKKKDRKINLQNFENIETRNDVVYQTNARKSFALKHKSASVPDLEMYDFVTSVRAIQKEGLSDVQEYEQSDQPTVKILKNYCDRHSGYYKFPLQLKTMYSNANNVRTSQ